MVVEVGKILTGKVSRIVKFGAFIELPSRQTGFVHISEISAEYVKDVNSYITVGQEVQVRVISVESDGKIGLSIKKAGGSSNDTNRPKSGGVSASFEDRLAKFMKDSDEKFRDLKKNFESKRGSGYKNSAQ